MYQNDLCMCLCLCVRARLLACLCMCVCAYVYELFSIFPLCLYMFMSLQTCYKNDSYGMTAQITILRTRHSFMESSYF